MKMYVSRMYADESITMANNIIAGLADRGSLMHDIMSHVFEGDWRQAIHPEQDKTGYGYEVWCITINGKMGWFRPSDNLPARKGNYKEAPHFCNSPFVRPQPITYNTSQKSTLSFLTRLFRF